MKNLIISFIFRSVWLIFQPTRLIAGAIGLSVANCFDWHSLDEPVKRESTRRIRLRQQVGSGYLFKFKKIIRLIIKRRCSHEKDNAHKETAGKF